MKQLEIQDLLDLKIHDTVKVENGVQAVRVPGGWIYYLQTSETTSPIETFVPEPYSVNYSDRILNTERRKFSGKDEWLLLAMFLAGIIIALVFSK